MDELTWIDALDESPTGYQMMACNFTADALDWCLREARFWRSKKMSSGVQERKQSTHQDGFKIQYMGVKAEFALHLACGLTMKSQNRYSKRGDDGFDMRIGNFTYSCKYISYRWGHIYQLDEKELQTDWGVLAVPGFDRDPHYTDLPRSVVLVAGVDTDTWANNVEQMEFNPRDWGVRQINMRPLRELPNISFLPED